MRPSDLVAVAAGLVRPGARSTECDDRFVFDEEHGVFLVADALGPSYGGYHLPIALDAALAAVCRGVAGSRETDAEARLRAGVAAGAALLDEAQRAYATTLAAQPNVGSNRMQAARSAAAIHARERFGQSIDAHVHHATSLTAVCIHRRRLTVAQVGSSRAYLVREGAVDLLLLDHLLASVTNDPALAELQADICTRMLGFGRGDADVDYHWLDVFPGDVVVLLGQGAWRQLSPEAILDTVRTSLGAPQGAVERLAARIPESSGASAALGVVEIREGA